MANLLPQSFADLNDITTTDRTVVTLYGRKVDGTLIALNCDNFGNIGVNATVSVTPGGSANSYFCDQAIAALDGSFATASLAFGFTSFNVTLFNDSAEVIEFSFDGTNVHGRLGVGDGVSMDNRAQIGISLRTVSGNPAAYRLMVY